MDYLSALEKLYREALQAGLLSADLVRVAVDLEPEASTDLFTVTRQLGARMLMELNLRGESATTMLQLLGHQDAQRLINALREWIARQQQEAGIREKKALARAVNVPPPPDTAPQVRLWAREQDVVDELTRPVTELEPWLREHRLRERYYGYQPDRASLEGLMVVDALDKNRLPDEFKQLHTFAAIVKAARGYLAFKASRKAWERRRESLWAGKLATGPERVLAGRLKEALAALQGSDSTDEPLFFDKAEMTVSENDVAVVGRFQKRGTWARDDSTRISIAGFESQALTVSCSCSSHSGEENCRHRRVLLEWALDALYEADDPANADLRALVQVPTHTRLLEAIAKKVGGEALDDSEQPRRIAWRLGVKKQQPVIVPTIQKMQKNGRWSRGSVTPISQLRNQIQLLDEHDRRLFAPLALADVAVGGRTSADSLAVAFHAAAGHPRLFSVENTGTPVVVERVRPVIILRERDGRVSLAVRIGRRVLPGGRAIEHLQGEVLIVDNDEGDWFGVARVGHRLIGLLGALRNFPAACPPDTHATLLQHLLPLQEDADLEVPPALHGQHVQPENHPHLRLDLLPGGGLEAQLLMAPLEGSDCWAPGSGPPRVFAQLRDGSRCSTERDFPAELKLAAELIDQLGLADRPLERSHRFLLAEPEEALDLIAAARDLGEKLTLEWPEEKGWRVSSASISDLRVRVEGRTDWFGVTGEVEVDGESIPLRLLLETVRAGRRYVKLGPGKFAHLEAALLEQLQQAEDVVYEQDRKNLAVGPAGAERLDALFRDSSALECDDAWNRLITRIDAAAKLHPEPPETLEGTLRGYQVDGYRWLARLSAWDAGCCLADDMGLGKTIQALALLLDRAANGPVLVVAPTSVGSVWLEQTRRFAPRLRPLVYRGPKRSKLLEELGPGVLLITSYDILAIDIEKLESLQFDTLILDEAQAIKNAKTQRANAARRVNASFRMALTGTPMENHLGELWSIFAAVNPGLLGPWRRFKDRFASPIEKYGSRSAREALTRLLRPFILRRRKEQVAPELPPRTEVVHPVELSVKEQRAYDAARQEILESMAARTGPSEGNRIQILAGITRLRRLACHPRLIDAGSALPSAKQTEALALLRRLVDEGQRALVFSQFTGHLALVREELDRYQIPYLYLDGSTPAKKRGDLVERWAEARERLFLISLKAGGTGLNLTGADMVLHLDPWWNPAVEDQATDRTHRIGQTKPVTVVRLIVQGTIEEAVIGLHQRKRELAQSLLEGADTVGKLSAQELTDLIRWGTGQERVAANG